MAKFMSAMLVVVALGLAPVPAHAQLARTFVSAARGDDGHECSRATPCRTFQAAHDKTIDQGEIIVLAPGSYGPVLITKSISIINDGTGEVSIAVEGDTAAIVVNAPATGAVLLRGLTIQGIGFGGDSGIRFNTGLSLTLENCVIRRRNVVTNSASERGLPAPRVVNQ